MNELEEYKNYLLSSGADPNEVAEYGEYLKSQGAIPPPEQSTMEKVGSTAEAALQGFGQGGTLGYLPEINARVEQGLNTIVPESMGGSKGFNTGDRSYEEILASNRARDKRLQTESPLAYGGGNIAGAISTIPVGGAALKGVGAAAKLAGAGKAVKGVSNIAKAIPRAGVDSALKAKMLQSAVSGAAYGGAMNPEQYDERGEMIGEPGTMSNIQERGKNLLIGGIGGAAGEGLLAGGGSMLKAFGKKLKERSTMKQIGANAGQVEKILEKGDTEKVRQFLVDEGLMGVGKTVDDVAGKTSEIIKKDGPKIGQLYSDVRAQADEIMNAVGKNSSGLKVSGNELADKILENAKKEYRTDSGKKAILKNIEDATEVLRELGDDINIEDLHSYRMSLDDNINWAKSARERDAVQQSYINARNIVADEAKRVINQLDKIVGGEKGKALTELNKRFSSAATVNKISTKAVAREHAKVLMGQGVVSGGAGLATGLETYRQTGDLGKAVGVGALTAGSVYGGRKYGSTVGHLTGRGAEALSKIPTAIGNRSGAVGVGAASPWLQVESKKKKKGKK
jgi:hypothetical protein